MRNGRGQIPRIIAGLILAASFAAHAQEITEALRTQAVGILRTTLADEERWVKVHAAEHLLALQYTEGVREAFERERTLHENTPEYRIGIWRVLARCSTDPAEYESWVSKIRAARNDRDAPDRLHATESLAKLGYQATDDEIPLLELDAQSDDGPLAAFAACILVHSGQASYEDRLTDLLQADDERTRLCAAYALRHIGTIADASRDALIEAAHSEPDDSSAKAYLVSSAYWRADDPALTEESEASLRQFAENGSVPEKAEAIAALGERADANAIPWLRTLLEDSEADVRASAAHALLRIGRRAPHLLSALDWIVIAAYFGLMIGLGWYYSRRTATEEEYMLGGRTMNPVTVGFSMFASLLSTLTYLSIPGEMVKHGPMIISQYLAWPLIFIVIGFVLIPIIMRQNVSSAYEILEVNLGPSVRVLGSFFFLSLRFMWMALIIYATSNKVLIPLLGLDDAYTPFVCAVLGAITISYTSMGGLRAVVMSDVIQTGILFGGAILTIVLITANMGGVAAWWPNAWPQHWDHVKIMYDPGARITIAGAMTSAFVWYVCTAGSDQVAIQRYLATRDVRAARRVMMTSLTTDVLVGVFLATLGIALWSYFMGHPHMLPDNYASLQNADTLFPRYISLALPTGISGLVIAGLLAAAMSSLSSGVNSSSLVITVDFIERFAGKKSDGERENLRRAKRVTVFIGIAVILLSISVGMVGGNLLEVVYKVVNLLVAPLFILFFMALFVPWATAPGAIAAGLASAATAVAVAYGEFHSFSFIWIMPLALLTGVIVGPLVSAIPLPGKTK